MSMVGDGLLIINFTRLIGLECVFGDFLIMGFLAWSRVFAMFQGFEVEAVA